MDNGADIYCEGEMTVEIKLGDVTFMYPDIITDVIQDGVLRNDFICQHIQKIDLKQGALVTALQELPCWRSNQAILMCQIKLAEMTHIPAQSDMAEVEIPRSTCLTRDGLVEPSPK